MKTTIKNTIIKQAIELGFDFESVEKETTLEELDELLQEFFEEKADELPQVEDECDVHTNGRYQTVSYGDFIATGEIVDFSLYWHEPPDTKVYHEKFVFFDDDDGLVKRMNLYYLVGETDYNTFNYENER
jgi:hypothetical protein